MDGKRRWRSRSTSHTRSRKAGTYASGNLERAASRAIRGFGDVGHVCRDDLAIARRGIHEEQVVSDEIPNLRFPDRMDQKGSALLNSVHGTRVRIRPSTATWMGRTTLVAMSVRM